MRRNHYIVLVVLIILLWIAVLNYAFVKLIAFKQRSSVQLPAINQNFGEFEKELDLAINNSDILIRNLKHFLRNSHRYDDSSANVIVGESNPNAYQRDDDDRQWKIVNDENAVKTRERLPFGGGPVVGSFDVSSTTSRTGRDAIAVLVIACDRVTISKCLNGLLRYRPSESDFPIIVSQDCVHQKTADVIGMYRNRVHYIHHPNQEDITLPPKEKKFKGYYKIARHYGWALNQVFFKYNFNATIIVEDDLEVAPDFYEYFRATLPILQRDPSIWCVSAWNDNGIPSLINRTATHLLYRSDFFPGLGWMLTKNLWLELMDKWPNGFWDDWMRQPQQRKNRACIRPELSRTKTFGKIGVSNGLFYEKHLKNIYLNNQFTYFGKLNLTFLTKNIYDYHYENIVSKTPLIGFNDLSNLSEVHHSEVRIVYRTRESFKRICKKVGLMDDMKSDVPRTAYRGIISFFYKQKRVFLVPEGEFRDYEQLWTRAV